MRYLPVLFAGLAVCASLLAGPTGAEANTARAEIKDAEGKKIGEATLRETRDGVAITASFTALPPGTRAFHVHEVGKCEPPFESAGGHFNPTGERHGRENPQGPHAGDLPNIEVPETGRVTVEALVRNVSLNGSRARLLDADGASLVVHRGTDDNKTDPAGNAGERIACGVITQ